MGQRLARPAKSSSRVSTAPFQPPVNASRNADWSKRPAEDTFSSSQESANLEKLLDNYRQLQSTIRSRSTAIRPDSTAFNTLRNREHFAQFQKQENKNLDGSDEFEDAKAPTGSLNTSQFHHLLNQYRKETVRSRSVPPPSVEETRSTIEKLGKQFNVDAEKLVEVLRYINSYDTVASDKKEKFSQYAYWPGYPPQHNPQKERNEKIRKALETLDIENRDTASPKFHEPLWKHPEKPS